MTARPARIAAFFLATFATFLFAPAHFSGLGISQIETGVKEASAAKMTGKGRAARTSSARSMREGRTTSAREARRAPRGKEGARPSTPRRSSGSLSAGQANFRHAFRNAAGAPGKPVESFKAPYSGRAREVTLKRDRTFVRVHGAHNKMGTNHNVFMVRYRDIKGLSPSQIKDKLALKHEPTHLTIVRVPAGSKMRVGKAAPQKEWNARGGGMQYETTRRPMPSDFKSTSVLKSPTVFR
jgi:hypothetical protein